MLTVLNAYTRKALCVTTKSRIGYADVLGALYSPVLITRKPGYLRCDDCSEFIVGDVQLWLKKVGIKPIHIYSGSPRENGHNERFNGTLRREILRKVPV